MEKKGTPGLLPFPHVFRFFFPLPLSQHGGGCGRQGSKAPSGNKRAKQEFSEPLSTLPSLAAWETLFFLPFFFFP